jgi:two-component system response regulator
VKDKVILPVEDDPKDEALTLRALNKSKVHNEVVVARDGAEVIGYLFCQDGYSGRDVTDLPTVVVS